VIGGQLIDGMGNIEEVVDDNDVGDGCGQVESVVNS